MKFSTKALVVVAVLSLSSSTLVVNGDASSSVRRGQRRLERDDMEITAASLRYLQEESDKVHEGPGLIEQQLGPNPYASHPDPFQLVLEGEFSLSSVFVPPFTLEDARADYCNFKFDSQKEDPSSSPFYVDLIGQSVHCTDHGFSVSLEKAANEARAYDSDDNSQTHSMAVEGFILHAPRSGASLVSNAIMAASPETTRVVSHSNVITQVLNACGANKNASCDRTKQIQILKDAVYLLGRTTDAQETKMYLTLDPQATVHLDLLREAFPQVPWMFIYRNPEVILQKVMDTYDKRMCLKNRRNPLKGLEEFVGEETSLEELKDEEVCSALLGTYFQKVVDEYERTASQQEQQQMGRLVNYDDELLTKDGIHNVLKFFNIDVTEDEEAQSRIDNQRQKKSNGMVGGSPQQSQTWNGEVYTSEQISDSVVQANQNYVHSLHQKAKQLQ